MGSCIPGKNLIFGFFEKNNHKDAYSEFHSYLLVGSSADFRDNLGGLFAFKNDESKIIKQTIL